MMGSARIWSLWDMLKDNALNFVQLGEKMQDTVALWWVDDFVEKEDGPLNQHGRERLKLRLFEMSELAERLNLPVSKDLLSKRVKGEKPLPATEDNFQTLVEILKGELKAKLFLFVPDHRASFWETRELLTDRARVSFPSAAVELRDAGNSYAAGLPTGTVFYSMRAVEHGLRALAADVGLTFDVQQWGEIIDQIASRITDWSSNGIPGCAKADKNERLHFLSEAAKEFVYFKDGWRNYVSHLKVSYGEPQALTVMSHVGHFIDRLSERLKEPT